MPKTNPSPTLRLGILRHSLAAKRDIKEYPDDDARPLIPKGRKLAKKVAKSFSQFGFKPNRILTSPLPRAAETAAIIAKGIDLQTPKILSMPVLRYDTDPHLALRYLASLKLRGEVLIVGHEPWLGEFLSLLVFGKVGPGLPFRKCGFALSACDVLAAGRGQLIAFLPPC